MHLVCMRVLVHVVLRSARRADTKQLAEEEKPPHHTPKRERARVADGVAPGQVLVSRLLP